MSDNPQLPAMYQPQGADLGHPLFDPSMYQHLWMVAKTFAGSRLVPESLRGKPEDCLLALALAKRSGQDPLSVMQSIHFVKGKAGWAATYLIARAKVAGMPIRWDVENVGADLTADFYPDGRTKKGTRPIRNLSITGWAMVDDVRAQTTITTADAIAEGWTRNPKYFTMLDQMLRYRTATRLVRLYMPEVMLGLPPVEELHSTPDPEPVVAVVVEAQAALDADGIGPEEAQETPPAAEKREAAPVALDGMP